MLTIRRLVCEASVKYYFTYFAASQFSEAMNDAEKAKLYAALDYEEGQAPVDLPPEVGFSMKFEDLCSFILLIRQYCSGQIMSERCKVSQKILDCVLK